MNKLDKKFPVLLGLLDGILTALTLSSGMLIKLNAAFDFNLAIRVAVAALVSGGFVFFVAKYAQLRGQLIHAEKELNLTSHGRLATTALGKKILLMSINDAIISGICSFLGAFFPLSIAALIPHSPWITLFISMLILGIIGLFLGRVLGRHPIIWFFSLMFGGIIVTVIGAKLHILN